MALEEWGRDTQTAVRALLRLDGTASLLDLARELGWDMGRLLEVVASSTRPSAATFAAILVAIDRAGDCVLYLPERTWDGISGSVKIRGIRS